MGWVFKTILPECSQSSQSLGQVNRVLRQVNTGKYKEWPLTIHKNYVRISASYFRKIKDCSWIWTPYILFSVFLILAGCSLILKSLRKFSGLVILFLPCLYTSYFFQIHLQLADLFIITLLKFVFFPTVTE